MSDPYPFESDDDEQIRELDLDSVDSFAERRITVGQLVNEQESWRFGHVIVDEAQDLTPMQWRMVMRRVRGRSLTVVGDLAQRAGGAGTSSSGWADQLPPELETIDRRDLTINYRSPIEVHDLAVAVLAEFAPGVQPSRAIRSAGHHPEFHQLSDLDQDLAGIVVRVLDQVGGHVVIIGAHAERLEGLAARYQLGERVSWLTPLQAKGLEFDAVVLLEPAHIWALVGGPSLLYVALTRATQRLVVLHQEPLPDVLIRSN